MLISHKRISHTQLEKRLPSTAFKDNFPTMQDIGLVKLSEFEFNSFGKWVL